MTNPLMRRSSLDDGIDRVGLFIDAANLHMTGERLGLWIDYRALLSLVRTCGCVAYAGYYTGLSSLAEESHERRRVAWLARNGYQPVLRLGKRIVEADGTVRNKADMDERIAVDMLEMALAGRIDHAILCRATATFSRRSRRSSVVASR